MKKVKIFKHLKELDAFVLTEEYKRIAEHLGLDGWERYAWIGRLFTMDNDFGEHWFDNWELREQMADEAEKLGFDEDELLIVDASRFADTKDGPCHTDTFRKRFWMEVLQNLELSPDLIIEEARANFQSAKELGISDFKDFEARVQTLNGKNGGFKFQ
ncbi:MAG: hypothetical protein ACKVUS_08625 [Saprospiraceae bacterium]